MDFEQLQNIEQFEKSSLEFFSGADIERLESMEELSEGRWQQLEASERLDALRDLETKLADIQGREPRLVELNSSLSSDVNGFFNPLTGKITLNEDLLNNRLNAISTIAHEGRHAYQWDAIIHRGLHPDYQEVQRWKDCFINYNDGNPTPQDDFFYGNRIAQKLGFAKYWNQPVEVDARLYEENVKHIFC